MHKAAVAAVVTALALAGCSGADSQPEDTATAVESTASTPSPSETPDESPSSEPTAEETDDSHDAIEIEIEGDKITPNGQRVEVPVGGHVLLEIDSDRAGELHVHSSPEQELGFKKGESTVEVTIDRPGVVDVEEHESGVVILQLEVS